MKITRVYNLGGKDGKGKDSSRKTTLDTWPEDIVPLNMDELYRRQMFAESRFKNEAVSPAGAMGVAQFMPGTVKDMQRFGPQFENFDPMDPRQAKEAQETYMMSFFTAPWNKGNEENQMVKSLAAYNYGSGNLLKLLEKLKDEGVDIYDSTEWISRLPEETKTYVKEIMYGDNERGFEDEYYLPETDARYEALFPPPQKKMTVKKREPLRETYPEVVITAPRREPEPQATQPQLDPRLQQAFKILRESNQ